MKGHSYHKKKNPIKCTEIKGGCIQTSAGYLKGDTNILTGHTLYIPTLLCACDQSSVEQCFTAFVKVHSLKFKQLLSSHVRKKPPVPFL